MNSGDAMALNSAAMQSQKAVTAHLKSKQLLPFGFVRHFGSGPLHSDTIP